MSATCAHQNIIIKKLMFSCPLKKARASHSQMGVCVHANISLLTVQGHFKVYFEIYYSYILRIYCSSHLYAQHKISS